tara:strand:+ start:596 stop:835 length:240 start_codon:yes stop_codon:yes gene_type:complete
MKLNGDHKAFIAGLGISLVFMAVLTGALFLLGVGLEGLGFDAAGSNVMFFAKIMPIPYVAVAPSVLMMVLLDAAFGYGR